MRNARIVFREAVGCAKKRSAESERAQTWPPDSISMLLGPPFRFGINGPGGWIILHEPELHFGPGPDKLVPDLAGWRRTRMADAVGGDLVPAHYDVAPDWVFEVLSLRTQAVDRGAKIPIYAGEGVGFAWLVDPLAHVLEVHRLVGAAWRLDETYRGNVRVRAAPFEAIELDLAMVWSG